MLNKNVSKLQNQTIASLLLDNNDYRITNPLELKFKLIEEIRRLMKNNVSIALSAKDHTITIKTESNRLMKDQKETIKYNDFSSYLNDMHFNFYRATDGEDFQNSYMYLLKAQKLVNFMYKKNKTLVNDKDFAIANLNEIVFLQSHGLSEMARPLYKTVLNFFKVEPQLAGKPSTSMLKDKQFFGYFVPVFEKHKLKLRTLLSMCLSFSEKFEHAKAITKAEKAFNTALELLLTTLIVAYHYLFKNIEKMEKAKEAAKENRKLVKIEYFANLVNILKRLIKTIDGASISNLNKSSYLNDIFLYESKIDKLMASSAESSEFNGYGTSANFYNTQTINESKTMNFVPTTTGQNFNKINNPVLSKVSVILKKYADKPDLIILNNEKVIESSFLNETTILTLSQLNYYNYTDIFVTDKLKNEITESSILEKIAFVVISLYVLATEHRFLEHKKNAENVFYKFLFDYIAEPKKRQSELFLSKAVEIAFSYLSDNFPFVSQIFNVFKKFELNRGKQIPENNEDEDQYRYLLPIKNGFRSGLIIPVVKVSGEKQHNIFDFHRHELFKAESQDIVTSVQKRLSSSNKPTVENFHQRRSANNKRIRSTEFNKQTRTAILMKNNNYLEKIKKPLAHTTKEISLSNTAESFFKHKKASNKPTSGILPKGKVNDENVVFTASKKQSVDKPKMEVSRPKSAKGIEMPLDKNNPMHLSPVIQKYLANKLNNTKTGRSELPFKDSLKLSEQNDISNILQPNNNRLNINFTNVGNLNFVINSYTAGLTSQNASPKSLNSKVRTSTAPVSKQNLKKIFKDKSTLDEILNKFKHNV